VNGFVILVVQEIKQKNSYTWTRRMDIKIVVWFIAPHALALENFNAKSAQIISRDFNARATMI
jgi:hypothetical protein